MDAHYRAWFDDQLVRRFARKTAADFFKSETYFLERIAPEIHSVLDVGCASGRLIRLLDEYSPGCRYIGVDLVSDNIELARRTFPQAAFFLGNALDMSLGRTFDLVNATGVLQAEPRWKELLERMIAHSHRYVLCDVKLSKHPEDIADLTRAYALHNGERLYFIVLSADRLLESVRALRGIERAWLYGYETFPNPNTTVLPDVGTLVSAGLLLQKGKTAAGEPDLKLEVPEGLLS